MTPAGAARPRGLVCDCDPRSIRALRTVLGAADLDVDTTTTAEQALDRAAIRLPDAAIVALELPEPVDEEPCIRLDGLEIDLAARVLRHDDRETHLTPIECKLLRVLLLHRGRPLAHDLLLRRVWGPAWVDDAQTLRAHIANLRRKMRPFERYILTDHGVGHRFADEARGRDRERRLRLVSGSSHPAGVAKPRASLAEHQEARAIASSPMAIGAQ